MVGSFWGGRLVEEALEEEEEKTLWKSRWRRTVGEGPQESVGCW